MSSFEGIGIVFFSLSPFSHKTNLSNLKQSSSNLFIFILSFFNIFYYLKDDLTPIPTSVSIQSKWRLLNVAIVFFYSKRLELIEYRKIYFEVTDALNYRLFLAVSKFPFWFFSPITDRDSLDFSSWLTLIQRGGVHSTKVVFTLHTQRPGLESHVYSNPLSSAYVRDCANAVSGEGLKWMLLHKKNFNSTYH